MYIYIYITNIYKKSLKNIFDSFDATVVKKVCVVVKVLGIEPNLAVNYVRNSRPQSRPVINYVTVSSLHVPRKL